jgi:hypothetical protein
MEWITLRAAGLVIFIGAMLLVPGSAYAEESEPAEPVPTRETPALTASLEYEDVGAREVYDRYWGMVYWVSRFWRTVAALNRGEERLLALEHAETERSTANLFGGRLPLEELWEMGESKAFLLAHGMTGLADSWGTEEAYWNIGVEADARLTLAALEPSVKTIYAHFAGSAYRGSYDNPFFGEGRYWTDTLRLIGGVQFPFGTGILVGLTHYRMEQKDLFGRDRDHTNTSQGFLFQDMDADLPVFGDLFFALCGYIDNREKDWRTRVVNWCAGTFDGKGELRLGFQHTGRTDFRRDKRFDFTFALNDRFTRETHFRRISYRDGGMNDLGGTVVNVMDFERDSFVRPLLELPDYTRTAGATAEVQWIKRPAQSGQAFSSFAVVAYPVGIIELTRGGKAFSFPNWVWFGWGYDTGSRKMVGTIGINIEPWKTVPLGFKLELEKTESSHHTVYMAGFWRL